MKTSSFAIFCKAIGITLYSIATVIMITLMPFIVLAAGAVRICHILSN